MTRRTGLRATILAALCAAAGMAAPPMKTIASMDLSKPFATRAPWHFTARQGPSVSDTPSGDTEDGAITLCISKDGGRTCQPSLEGLLTRDDKVKDDFFQPHYLAAPTIVHPTDKIALLKIEVSSLHAGNGDYLHALALLSYDRARDGFVPVYRHFVGRNNNQEIRYVPAGPLRGAVISAEPTQDAPFGYWVTVSRLSGAAYRQVVRYRSGTRYGDNNPLAVIDAEMPAIQQRLGLWRPGQPLPVPAKGCAKPHLVKSVLWC
ncbi:hypothetical protein [Sphingomonas sp.]|uniref:hypothetical protein n=1 Tax=Sphingomonas sp. TaxID=28214 RepID=UPI003B3A9AF9